jgi:xylulose-5-phosphate/fructose-6-phosphate phosphoketolase
MPGEVIDRPNPQPLASHIPDSVLELSVKLEKVALSDADLKGLEEFRRASNYIAAGMVLHFIFILKETFAHWRCLWFG